jgi:hypothetical protein
MKVCVLKGFAHHGAYFVALLVLSLGVTAVSHAQAAGAAVQPATKTAVPAAPAQTTPSDAPTRAASPAGKPSGKGMHEGITVHGHWMIEVRNPDGKLVSHTEFENSLSDPEGASYGVLGGLYTAGEWGIALGDPTSPPCTATIPPPFGLPHNNLYLSGYPGPFCVLSQVAPPAAIAPTGCASSPASGCSQNLVEQAYLQFSLYMSGSVVVPKSGQISQVQTLLSLCYNNISHPVCAAETTADNSIYDSVESFTAATLPAPGSGQCGGTGQISCAVQVTAGQTVDVTVTITF